MPDPANNGLARDDRAGRYRQRVTLEAPAEPQDTDAGGDPGDTWSAVAECWAQVIPLGGRRESVADQLVTINEYRIKMRWRPGVSGRMRLDYGGEKLNILAANNPDARRVELVLDCESWAR